MFADLPADVREDAKQAYRLFRDNPSHPCLNFKRLEGLDGVYSARIGLNYRAVATLKKNRAVRYWIGSHAEYGRLI